MKIRILSLILLTALLLTVFTACGKKSVLTAEQAQQIALEDAGLTAKEVTDVHTHVVTGETPGYSIHIVHGDTQYSYLIDAVSGEILESDAD